MRVMGPLRWDTIKEKFINYKLGIGLVLILCGLFFTN